MLSDAGIDKGFGQPCLRPAEGKVAPVHRCWHWLGFWASVPKTAERKWHKLTDAETNSSRRRRRADLFAAWALLGHRSDISAILKGGLKSLTPQAVLPRTVR
eukprot:5763156-Amphidinium_carterae.1